MTDMKKFTFFLAAFFAFLGSTNVNADDIQTGLIRLHNRRTQTSYLTTTANGAASGANKAASGFSQIWISEKSGTGYTLRSANTGEYLQANFSAPSSAKATLYIQNSPNASGYVNISSSSNFSGQTCLNLGQDGTTLYKWSYSGDSGSDWVIEAATDVTEEEVKQHFAERSGYTGDLSEGKYYRILCTLYNRAITEGSDLVAKDVDPTNFSQYWKLVKVGTGFAIQSVISDKFIQRQQSTSTPYHVGASKVAFNIKAVADKWEYKWTIAYGSDTQGLHAASTQGYNVVLWSTSADASVWAFQEVELSQEDIDAARGEQSSYDQLVQNKTALQKNLDNLFQDKACTVLKEDIQALSDEQLAANEDFAALNDDMKAMVHKVKNNTWQQFTNASTDYTADYERFFRIADYKVYSNYQDMSGSSGFTMSTPFGRLSGPTGIVADPNDIIYVYVDASPRTGCTLALEAVSTDGVAGDHPTGEVTTLRVGLNLFRFAEQKMLYIFHQLNDIKKYLADYPDIKVHIEGGQLNGYWDATRGMTNADWKLLQQDLLKAPFLNLKTQHLVFQMDADLVKAAEPNEMEGLMRIWDMIPENEDRYMGVEDFEGRYNNIWNVFSGASSYMHSTTYGTWYTESTIPTVMNYNNMRQPGNIWGPSHEIGHNHQGSINVIGTTESSNNLFSNINRFEQGIQTSRRQLPCDVFLDQSKGTPWSQRGIWQTTGLFFQLYLYFHVQHHDDNFLPNLFRQMRKSPINKGTWNGNVTYTNADGNTATGAIVANGANDYLKLARAICDVAQADLSELFEAYGMFVPVSNMHVSDYSNYLVTTSQSQIDAAKKAMKKYPKKLGNIMFIDDHLTPMKDADPDNKFEGKPAASGKKVNDTAQHEELGNGQPIGNYGDYEAYDGHEDYDVDGDYFTLSGSTISFKGKGYIGHKFYDLDGNLIWATNAKSATLPASLRTLGVDNFRVVAAQVNMQDVPCPYYKVGTSKVYKANVYFGKQEEEPKAWWGNAATNFDGYMPENAIAVVETEDAPESFVQATNVIDLDGTAASIAINGDLPFYLPSDVQAQSLTFTKTVDGYAALDLPFVVTSADLPGLQTVSYVGGDLSLASVDEVAARHPVVVNANVSLDLSDVALVGGDFQQLADAIVLNADGSGVENAPTASPFTFNLKDIGTGIQLLKNGEGEGDVQPAQLYDLAGRRIQKAARPGLYIVKGRKALLR